MSYSQLYNQILQYFENQKYTEVIKLGQSVSNKSKYYHLLQPLMARSFFSLGQFDESILIYRKLTKNDVFRAEALTQIGFVRRKKKKFSEALDAFKKVQVEFPNLWQAHFNVGLCFQDMGEDFKAIENYEKALEIEENLPQAYNNIAVVYHAQGEFRKSQKFYLRALQFDDEYWVALVQLLFLCETICDWNGIWKIQESVKKYDLLVDPTKSGSTFPFLAFEDNAKRQYERSVNFSRRFKEEQNVFIAPKDHPSKIKIILLQI